MSMAACARARACMRACVRACVAEAPCLQGLPAGHDEQVDDSAAEYLPAKRPAPR